MPLTHMPDLLTHTYRHGYAVGAFNIQSLDFIEAIVQAAENQRAPVILSLAEPHFEYFDFELAMAASVAAARRARVPIAIHLDRGQSLDSAVRAINLGCNGVMIDASTLTLDANVASTRAVAEIAHGCGVAVEGMLALAQNGEAKDVEQARDYVAQTGVDFLAVSMRRTTPLDLNRLQAIHEALDIPLAIHSGAGWAEEQCHYLIARGVAKITCDTVLADAAAQRIHANAHQDTRADYPSLLRDVRDAVRAQAERAMTLFGAAGRAEEVSKTARVWREVEHCIVYNVNKNLSDNELERMMAHGRANLSSIPGVRRVFTGRTLHHDAPYRYCWLVRFASPTVVASYRDHPTHVAFANTQFRPQAADRISIDFESIE